MKLRRQLGWKAAEIERLLFRQAELQLAQARAERNAESKTAFLATMSHEIRTPMSGVIGFTELLLESDLDPRRRGQVQLIADSGRAMMQLVNDILDHSRIESGEMRLHPEPLDIREKLDHCIKLLEPTARSKHLAIGQWVENSVPELVELDRLRIQQVLLNLIGNAIRYTEKGGIDVEARLENSSEGKYLLLSVIDTGIGIEESQLDEIFVPYRQENSASAIRSGGSGLGLAISSELVAMMGGQISVHSRCGVGTQFTVRLPLVTVETDVEAPHELTPASPPATLPSLRGTHVLIVEDDAINRQLIMAMAEALQLDAHTVGSGAEAVRAVLESDQAGIPFAVVLMDMQMPGMDGLEATSHLRALGFTAENLPIIALTANCYQDDIAACAAAGMQSHLGKPVTTVALARELARWLAPGAPVAQTRIHPSSHSIEARYQERKRRVIDDLRRIIEASPGQPEWQAIARQLHRLAGVAANFGEPELGEASRRLELELSGKQPLETVRRALRREWPIFESSV
ncbi:MAG: response regulator [Erythrobacter sp.]|nr:MAG: response regulator [Erythrobacter sp.]